MNEIEEIVKAIDTFEQLRKIDDDTMVDVNTTILEEVYIIDTDVEKMKNFLKKALEQLENLEIEVRVENE